MDSTLALGALRIARGAGGEGVDVNGSIVEREKGDEFGIETPASSSTIACGQQKVKGGHGSSTASSTASSSASSSASIISAAGAKKKSVRLASVFPSPPFRSADFAGPRRLRSYRTRRASELLANRKGRGRRRGGREREHRRAGEGRSVW